MANRIIVLHKGEKVHETNDVPEGIDYYIRNCVSQQGGTQQDYGLVQIKEVKLIGKDVNTEGDHVSVPYLGQLSVELELNTSTHADEGVVIIDIADRSKTTVASTRSDQFGYKLQLTGGTQRLKVDLLSLQLKPEIYYISVSVRNTEANYPMAVAGFVKQFQVTGFIDTDTAVHLKSEWLPG